MVVVASCGARTGLDLPFKVDARAHSLDASRDVTLDATLDSPKDAPPDVEMNDGHPLDVVTECATPTYCKANDPNYIYKCGVRVFECGTLEQCEDRCGDGGTVEAGADASGCHAACVNPCLDTLGQNTSNGCEFWSVEMDTTQEASGTCYAVFIVNQWNTGEPAKLDVELGGVSLPLAQFARIPVGTGQDITYQPFDPNVGLAQNQVAILFLSRDPNGVNYPDDTAPRVLANCPAGVTPAVAGDSAIHGTGIGEAFHIRSNVPVVAYQMLPYGGGSARVTGATLLLPTNVWGNNYLAADAYQRPIVIVGDGGVDAGPDNGAGPSMVVVAQTNDTHVTINPVVAIKGGPGVPPTGAGQPITYTLDQGQYVQFTQISELTGSAIQSDQPVAVIGGATLMDVPYNRYQRADHGEQMIPPVQALGNTYVGVRYRTRSPPVEEIVPWRIVGAVDGTVLTFDPPQPTAPATIGAHQLIEFDATGPFVVSSQDSAHPFYFAQYMTGGDPFQGVGDPEFVNVITPAQYLPNYTFFTDPTYPETNLVVVRVQDTATGLFPDVTLDCAGKLTGWQTVGASGTYQWTRIDLSTGDFVGQNGCNNGVHQIVGSFPSSDAGGGVDASVDASATPAAPMFGVTVWGWGNATTEPFDAAENLPGFTLWVSYGYPAGANITKLNDVVLSAQ